VSDNNEPVTEPEPYDLEAVYDAELAPLMTQIIEICKRHKMPMIASFAYACEDADNVRLCTTALPRDGWQPNSFKAAFAAIYRRPSLLVFTIRKADLTGDAS
jgi:hypothetical protein